MTQESQILHAQFNFPDDAPITLFGNAARRILASGEPELLLHLNAHRFLIPRSEATPVDTEGLRSRWPTSWATIRRPFPPARFDFVYVADLSGNEPKPVVERGLDVLHALTALNLSVGVLNLSQKLVEASPMLTRAIREGQIQLVDPVSNLGDYRIAALEIEARREALETHEAIEGFLDAGAALADRTLEPGTGVARRIGIWRRFREAVACDTIIVRDPLAPFGSVCTWIESLQEGRVISIQHGVVPGLHKYVPILGSTHLTYGPVSAGFLNQLNNAFAGPLASRHASPSAIGNFIHRTEGESRGGQGRLLVLDQSNDWADNYYGIKPDLEETLRIASSILSKNEISEVTVRPHPYCTDLDRWLKLRSAFGSRLAISHPLVPLSEDIREATVALSLFSGAALATAANGVPTFLVERKGRPWTPDLDPFAPVTFSYEEATEHISSVLSDEDSHQEWAHESLHAAQQYFGDTDYKPIDSATISQFI